MKLFYILAILFIVLNFLRDPTSEIDARIQDAVFIIIICILFAVSAIDERITQAVKEATDPNFNKAEENLKGWIEIIKLLAAVIVLFVAGTLAQGALRCGSSGEELSANCVWEGFWLQLDEDFS